VALLHTGESGTIEDVVAKLDEDETELLQSLLQETGEVVDAQRTISDSIAKIHARELRNRIRKLERLKSIADDSQKAEIDAQLDQLRAQSKALGKAPFGAFSRN
jgi:hypothetical protein